MGIVQLYSIYHKAVSLISRITWKEKKKEIYKVNEGYSTSILKS